MREGENELHTLVDKFRYMQLYIPHSRRCVCTYMYVYVCVAYFLDRIRGSHENFQKFVIKFLYEPGYK